MDFRSQLLRAIDDSDMSRRERRRASRRVNFMRSKTLKKMEQSVISQAITEGKIPEGQLLENFDWSALLSFIKELLPLILGFFK
jgi:hypothetical protein